MQLSDLLTERRIVVPMEAGNLRDALDVLIDALGEGGPLGVEQRRKLARDLAFEGDVIRINDDIIAVAGRAESLASSAAAVGVSPAHFAVSAEGRTSPSTARCVFVFLTPHPLGTLRDGVVPTVKRALLEGDRATEVLSAEEPRRLRAVIDLMDIEFEDRLLVGHAVTPLRYRIYPDTPLREVVDLMVRRGLRAVPVVGESYEVLGIITAGDALRHLVSRKPVGGSDTTGEEPPPESTAREVMTRAVLCVSEDQNLVDAANVMVNRDVEQVPVVREGEFVGFLTRDVVLRKLFGKEEEPDHTTRA